jgi:hypothetical protein
MNVFQYYHLDELKKWLCDRHDELHLQNSLIMPRVCVVGRDGTQYRGQGAKGLCQALNDGLGSDYDILSTYSAGRNRGTVFYGLQIEDKETLQKQKEEKEVVEENKEDLIPQDLEVVEEETVVEVVESEEPKIKEPDWEWIESLENNSEDRLELDRYAEEEFGVKLNRTMKLGNMIKKFKEELSKR